MTKKVLVGLSGGVDSAVAAYLLREQGCEVSGGFMINYLTEDDSCPTRLDMVVAEEVASFLGIPFFTFDFREEYEKRVLQYIFSGYQKGLTPNPDVFCNTWIKFDLFREEALSYGYDAVATGHYAQIFASSEQSIQKKKTENREELGLYRGIDVEKDQSYFLSALSLGQLRQALFPVGHLTKKQVRDIAQSIGLPNAARRDSQGLCFVGKVDFAHFLKSHISPKKGPIIDTLGNVVGEHDGAFQYTIGQRKGIGVGGGPALFVLDKDVHKNTIVVGTEDDPRLFRTECILNSLNWFVDPTLLSDMHCEAQIRYRQKPQTCRVAFHRGKASIFFDTPQRAITPGQVCVLYEQNRVLGSGIIV